MKQLALTILFFGLGMVGLIFAGLVFMAAVPLIKLAIGAFMTYGPFICGSMLLITIIVAAWCVARDILEEETE